jgi:uncharacterized protein GlcG (DUF336 family)
MSRWKACMRAERGLLAALALLLAACGGGGGSAGSAAAPCASNCGSTSNALAVADVERAVAQAAAEAKARGQGAVIAIVDRVGNVLAVYQVGNAPTTVDIRSGLLPPGTVAGLDGLSGTVPATQAAIAKALTGAFLSSQGNAFSTRTAGQIVQEHFDPGERGMPAGPLYGVQFSQLSCSDVNRNATQGSIGPKRSPLGLAADPGGLPLYKNGVLVGGIGVEADGLYSFDRDITDVDESDEENIAFAATASLPTPGDIRGERINADGRTFRFVDRIALRTDPLQAPPIASAGGHFVAVEGYVDGAAHAGTTFGTTASGIRPDDGAFAAQGAWILVDAQDANRFPPRAGAALALADVQALLREGYAVARRTRGQIRRPLGTPADVTISVVDTNGDVLGLIRTPDGPVFGIDVSVQKARTAMFFSRADAGAQLAGAVPADVLPAHTAASIASWGSAMAGFTNSPLDGRTAWSARAIGNLHRPYFPDGIDGAQPGPLSPPIEHWSPFNVGFQLDLVYNQLVKGVLGDTSQGCAGRLPAGAVNIAADTGIAALRNGAQIFPGGVPIYRGGVLVGAIGVSGDGVDQDDMVAYLGVANAAAHGATISNASEAMRADQLAPQGTRLRYVQCPQAPFLDSTEQAPCH